MTNILTDAEAKAITCIGAGDVRKQTLLDIAVAAVTTLLEDRCGPVVYGTVTGELHNGGRNYIYLDSRPVQSVITVVEYDNTTAGTLTAESNSSKPDPGYLVNLANGRITRRAANSTVNFANGMDNIYVTYVAGRYATQGSITEKWKLAAAITLKNAWRTWEPAVGNLDQFDVPTAAFPTFSVPKAVRELLGADWYAGSGTGDG